MATAKTQTMTRQDVLARYPRLVAHLICHSLGYFTPQSAAQAVADHRNGEECYCEWYSHMTGLRLKHAGKRRPTDAEWKAEALAVNREAIEAAFKYRHTHRGMMADYRRARALVEHVRSGGEGSLFASWF